MIYLLLTILRINRLCGIFFIQKPCTSKTFQDGLAGPQKEAIVSQPFSGGRIVRFREDIWNGSSTFMSPSPREKKYTHLFRLHLRFCHPCFLQKSTNFHESSEWRDQLCFNIAGKIIHQLGFFPHFWGKFPDRFSCNLGGSGGDSLHKLPHLLGVQVHYLKLGIDRMEIPP